MEASLNNLKSFFVFVIILFLSFASSSCKNIIAKDDIHKRENWAIKISGMIDDGAHYSVRVIYKSHSDSRWCKSWKWGLFSGSYYEQDSKVYEYFPEITNEHHHLVIPIGKVDPSGWCKLEEESVKLCVYTKDMPYGLSSCNKWFIRNPWLLPNYEIIKNYKLNDILDIECTLQKYSYPPYYKCFLGGIDKKLSIERRLKRGYSEYKVNIKLITVKENK